jgi:hypothetical protein
MVCTADQEPPPFIPPNPVSEPRVRCAYLVRWVDRFAGTQGARFCRIGVKRRLKLQNTRSRSGRSEVSTVPPRFLHDTIFTLACFGEELELYRNIRLGRPDALHARYALGQLGDINDRTGDWYVELDGRRFGVVGKWADELRRLKAMRLTR